MKFVYCFELGWWCRGDFWLGDWHFFCVCVFVMLSVMSFAICVHVSVPENDSFMISTLMVMYELCFLKMTEMP